MGRVSGYRTMGELEGMSRITGVTKNGELVHFSLEALADFVDKAVSGPIGVYVPGRKYEYRAKNNAYVSYSNPGSQDAQFRVERLYRLKATPGESGRSPESHPEYWVLQGDTNF